jgi:alpha-amylase
MTFPFIHDGIPIVYYGRARLPLLKAVLINFLGQEQGYQGGMDPYNREA